MSKPYEYQFPILQVSAFDVKFKITNNKRKDAIENYIDNVINPYLRGCEGVVVFQSDEPDEILGMNKKDLFNKFFPLTMDAIKAYADYDNMYIEWNDIELEDCVFQVNFDIYSEEYTPHEFLKRNVKN